MERTESRGPKVAHVTPYFWPVVGGITTYVHGVAQAQRRQGLDVRIYARSADFGPGVEVGPPNDLLFIRWAERRLRGWRPDVVHAHGEWSALAASQRLWGPVAPMTVFTVHTDFRPPRNALREGVFRFLMGRANVVTALNPASLQAIAHRFPNVRRLELVHPGTPDLREDVLATRPVARELHLGGCFPVLCAISMMVWPDKVRGLTLLIRSMSEVLQSFPSAKLIVIGDGPLRGEVEREVARAGLATSVLLIGQQSNPATYLAASDMFVHVSHRDAFPQVILEAMSIGKPVIVNTEIARNLPDDLVASGVVTVDSAPSAIASGVTRLAGDPKLRGDLSRSAGLIIRAEYTWDQVARRLLRTYGLSVPP